MTSQFDTARLVGGAGELWSAATTAPFLDGVGNGTFPRGAFDRWLVQDHLFVQAFTSFAAIVASKAPRQAQRVLINGLSALNDELDWFEQHGAQRALDRDGAEPHPICRRYSDYLLASAYQRPIGVLLAIFYGVEVSYCVAWGRLRPVAGDREGQYAEFIDRWTNAEFVTYVKQLEALADTHTHPDQQDQFNEVLRQEHNFWRMTWEG